jgi:uncharacterized protein YchJ
MAMKGNNMARKTDADKDKLHFQMDRFIQQNGEWFYMTREGEERGPFESKQDAEGDLIAYMRHRLNMEIYGQ